MDDQVKKIVGCLDIIERLFTPHATHIGMLVMARSSANHAKRTPQAKPKRLLCDIHARLSVERRAIARVRSPGKADTPLGGFVFSKERLPHGTSETAKEAFAKAIEWHLVQRFTVSISDGIKVFTIIEFVSVMALTEIHNTVEAASEAKPKARYQLTLAHDGGP